MHDCCCEHYEKFLGYACCYQMWLLILVLNIEFTQTVVDFLVCLRLKIYQTWQLTGFDLLRFGNQILSDMQSLRFCNDF